VSEPVPAPSSWRAVAFTALGLVFGFFALGFLDLLTGGMVLFPVAVGLVFLAPFILINYLLWGRSLSREVAQERAALAAGEKAASDPSP
jgi:hypothetical protein